MLKANSTNFVRPVKETWTNLKGHISDSTPLQYHRKSLSSGVYFLCFVKHNNYTYFTNIYPVGHWRYVNADHTDFVTNYKPYLDAKPPTDSGLMDGSKIPVHQTSRVPGTTTYFTCASDDQANASLIGGDVPENQKLKGHHEIGDPTTESAYLDLNSVVNNTYIHEGYLQWKDALNDEISVSFVPKLSATSAGTNTFYNLYQGYMIVPAAGDGTIDVDTMVLVEMPLNEFGKRSAAFWNADYNTTTKLFENIAAAPSGDGVYNMFTVEVEFIRFANKVPLLSSGFMNLQTSDASRLGHNIRLKVTAYTRGADHDWWWNAFATLHRMKTT